MIILFNSVCLDIGGGVASYSRSLLACLKTSFDHFVVGSRKKNEGKLGLLIRFCKDYFAFNKVINERHYDILHINPSLGFKALIRDGFFLFLAKRKGLKVLMFIHGWDIECERLIRSRFLKLFGTVFNKADAFIVLSNEFKRKLFEMGIIKPIHVETTIVDDEVFTKKIPHRGGCDKFHILYLSRIEKDKGIYETLDTYRLFKRHYPQARLTIAGDGNEFERVKAYAANLKLTDVRFLGFVSGEEKHKAFCNADVYFFPTTYGEGMPTTILEAMAYELPIVTRGVGGLNDFFENERMGFVTDSTDPDVFFGYLESLLLNPVMRLQIGRENRLYAQGVFAASVVASRIKAIYKGIVSSVEND